MRIPKMMKKDFNENRQSAKNLLQEQYQVKLQPYTHILKEVMKANKCNAFNAYLKITLTYMYRDNYISKLLFKSALMDMVDEMNEAKQVKTT